MKILQLSIFPCDIPRGGGEIRVAQINRFLTDFGHEVICAGVLSSSGQVGNRYFSDYPKKAMDARCQGHWYAVDYHLSQCVLEDPSIFKDLAERIPFVPDLIITEMPWFFPLAEKLTAYWGKRIPIIYSSHNVEHRLRQQVMGKAGVSDSGFIEKIRFLETEACRKASAVWAVSQSDAEWASKAGADRVYLCPNGVQDRQVTKEGERQFAKLGLPEKYALFCGSAHYPNVTGIFRVFKDGVGGIPPDCKLVLAGSIADNISSDKRYGSIPHFSSRVRLLGTVSEELIAVLLQRAHCIILPVFEGGGTNLKTAEAIWTGCHIVSTSTAMRGFEAFRDWKNVHIADDSAFFQQSVRQCLALPKADPRQRLDERREVLWEHCLRGIARSLRDIGPVK